MVFWLYSDKMKYHHSICNCVNYNITTTFNSIFMEYKGLNCGIYRNYSFKNNNKPKYCFCPCSFMPHSSNAQKSHIKSKNKLEQSQRLSWEAVVDGWCLSGCIQSWLLTAGGLGSHLSAEGPWHVGPQQFYMKADMSQQVYVCVCVFTVSTKIWKDVSEAADASDSGAVSK